jgi:hypothetical protein
VALHKIFRGDTTEAAKLLPFALNKLKSLKQILTADSWSQSIAVGPDRSIRLAVSGDEETIVIWAERRPGYEFFTSNAIDNDIFLPPGTSAVVMDGYGTKVEFAHSKTRRKAALFEAAREPYTASWPVVSWSGSLFTSEPAWQNQKLYESVWWPNNQDHGFVSSPSGMSPYQTNVCGALSQFSRFFYQNRYYSVDVGWDIKPTYQTAHARGHNPGILNLPQPRWWRRACLQTVTHETFGTRTFMIVTDALTRFYAFPLQEYPGGVAGSGVGTALYSEGVVPEGSYQSADVPYPAWVTTDSATLGGTQMWVWEFNSKGTRAVSCPFQRLLYTYDAGFPIRHKIYQGFVLTGTCVPPDLYDTLAALPGEDYPGLVEVALDITLTGPSALDYTFKVSVTREEHSLVTNRIYLAAGYAFKDARLAALGVNEDDLIGAEIGVRTNSYLSGLLLAKGVDPATADPQVVIDTLAHDVGYPTGQFPLDVVLRLNRLGVDLTPETVREYPLANNLSVSIGHVPFSGITLDDTHYVVGGYEGHLTQVSITSDLVVARALDLRTLSLLEKHNNGAGTTYGYNLHLYGSLAKSAQVGVANPPLSASELSALPVSLAFLSHLLGRMLVRPDVLHSFSIHPSGAIAIATPALFPTLADPMFVDVIRFKDGTEYTHKDLFNQAFGLNRDYSFYLQNPSALRGSFRTWGVWI